LPHYLSGLSGTARRRGPRAISLSCDDTSELRWHLTVHLDAARTDCISCFLKALKQIAPMPSVWTACCIFC